MGPARHLGQQREVNNASATKHVANSADLDALSADDFHRIFGVNTIGPFQMIRALSLC